MGEATGGLGIEHPILQAPMAGISPPAMAAAVSDAGGLGSIGIGALEVGNVGKMLSEIRERSSGPFNVNVFAHRPAMADVDLERAWIERLRPSLAALGFEPPAALCEIYTSFVEDDAMLALLIEQKLSVVSFHFGLPDRGRIRTLREAGIILLVSATSLAEARQAMASGVHVIVARGYEAGGHRGMFDPDAPDDCLGTFALTRILTRELDISVIAAGGIMDGAGISAALALGATAAQLGTALPTKAIAPPSSARPPIIR